MLRILLRPTAGSGLSIRKDILMGFTHPAELLGWVIAVGSRALDYYDHPRASYHTAE
ncbi:hypothetical protein OAL43_02720 [bacterium]|nr:hypothetical protein [bacterium]